MTSFEFLFSLFGLLLGFSIAELARGFSRAYDRRKYEAMGALTPVLAALLIVDLLSFWYGAWFLREMTLKFWVVMLAAIVGLLYYFAATQVFPREGSGLTPGLHIMEHRKGILVAVIAANLVMFFPKYVNAALTGNTTLLRDGGVLVTSVYLALLAFAATVPNRKWVLSSLLAALTLLVAAFLVLDY